MPSQRLADPATAMIVTAACKAAKVPRALGDSSREVSITVSSPDVATAARERATDEVRPLSSPSSDVGTKRVRRGSKRRGRVMVCSALLIAIELIRQLGETRE